MNKSQLIELRMPRNWPFFLIFFCYPVFFCHGSSATTFLVAKAGSTIVVGADCRSTLTIDYTKHVPGPDVCKIRKCASDMYFVISAQPFIDIKTGIDFSRLAENACSSSRSPLERADIFERHALSRRYHL